MMKNTNKFGAFAVMAAAVVMCAVEARATTKASFSGVARKGLTTRNSTPAAIPPA